MRLVLQCAICGTVQHVGAATCETCRATGLQNLRLMFECTECFRLGLSPSCGVCNPTAVPAVVVAPLPLAPPPTPAVPPVEVITKPEVLEELWGVEEPVTADTTGPMSDPLEDAEPGSIVEPPTEEFVLKEEDAGGVELATALDPDSEFELAIDDATATASDDELLRLDDELELDGDDE